MKLREILLKKHQEGQLSEEELAWLINDLMQAPDRQDYALVLQQLWEEADQASLLLPSDSQRLLATFQERRHKGKASTGRSPRIRYAVAASVVLLLVAAVVGVLLQQSRWTAYTTDYGQTRTVLLPDSSQVVLNANSSLRYPSHWNVERPREVWLDGEAYFSVTHTQNHQKFFVHVSDGFQVEVLGTEFNIKDRREVTQVILNSGRVTLAIQKNHEEPETLAMQPGDLVEFSEADQTILKKQVDPTSYVAWREHKLIFDKRTLREIVRQLEDTYGVSIAITSDTLANTRLTGAFPTTNLENILTSLPTIVPMQITKTDERHMVFRPK